MEEKKGIALVEAGGTSPDQKIIRNRRIAILLAAVLVASGLFLAFWNRSFDSYKNVTSSQLSEGAGTQFANFKDGFLKYSKDGITYLSQKEDVIWTEAYTMTSPKISVCEEYAVLADLSGNDVHLYGVDGKIGDYSMGYPIKNIIAAKNGVFCVVLDASSVHYIQLYNQKGTLLAEIKTQIENNGYPLSVDISSDGEKLVASYYRIEGIESKNVLSFYHFGEGGKGKSGNLVGTYQFEDLLIPKVEFLDDNTVCAIGDTQTLLYKMKNEPKLSAEIPFSSEIKSVFCSEGYIGYICENTEEDFEDGREDIYQVWIYNKSGRAVQNFGKNELHENIKIVGDLIVSYSLDQCVMEKTDGTVIYAGNLDGNIVDILPTNKRREYYVVYSQGSSRIRLKNDVDLKELVRVSEEE